MLKINTIFQEHYRTRLSETMPHKTCTEFLSCNFLALLQKFACNVERNSNGRVGQLLVYLFFVLYTLQSSYCSNKVVKFKWLLKNSYYYSFTEVFLFFISTINKSINICENVYGKKKLVSILFVCFLFVSRNLQIDSCDISSFDKWNPILLTLTSIRLFVPQVMSSMEK